jgi:hypothetical protein
MTDIATVAAGLKDTMVTAIKSVVDPAVLVAHGHPGLEVTDDMIGVGRVTSAQEPATMGTNRSREETLTVDVTISCYRGGGPEMEKVASDQAYALLRLIERYCRITDTTMGGVVRQCFLTSHESDGATDPAILAEGRLIELTATFTALARITA